MSKSQKPKEPPLLPRRSNQRIDRTGHIAASDASARNRGKQPATARHVKNYNERMSECSGACCNRICIECRVTCDRCGTFVCPECAVRHVSVDSANDVDLDIDYQRLCLSCVSFITNNIHDQYVSQVAFEEAPRCFPLEIQNIKPDFCPARRELVFSQE